ncbi:MAG TPA: hypothetical protein VH593_05735 [Ktedonobacteraceae bacterium]|jgi:hypothetical protein
MTLYERLKEIQSLIGCAVQVEIAGHWTDGYIHEIYIGKEIKVTISIGSVFPSVQLISSALSEELIRAGVAPDVVSTIQGSVHIELVGADEIHRRLKYSIQIIPS